MSDANNDTKESRARALPSVDALLRTGTARRLLEAVGPVRLAMFARRVNEELRASLLDQDSAIPAVDGAPSRSALLSEAERQLEKLCQQDRGRGTRRVINATGVILHTNLGRAPLSEAATGAIAGAAGYCTLEYDLENGSRGRRGGRVEDLLCELTGAEAALVVNNCAAAALLVLTVLARGGETIVSRGELVEIGGDFRVPDVMANSGTRMVEIGTTNRTRISDYRRAINEQTRLIMRVHPSNYRIVGFAASPTLSEVAEVARNARLPLYEDAGSGVLLDLSENGLRGEPVIPSSITDGADVVTFSGDKLLGGAQAGLIVGRREIIDPLRRAPLYRALRADKLALAALEATLDAHARGTAMTELPALRMLAMTPAEIDDRVTRFLSQLTETAGGADARLVAEPVPGESAIGGGSAPLTRLKTTLIGLTHKDMGAQALEKALRNGSPPIISRIAEERVLLDLRTVAEGDETHVLKVLAELNGSGDEVKALG